jgi:hypothetical protein
MRESKELKHAKILLALAELNLDLMGGANEGLIDPHEFNSLCNANTTTYWRYWEKWIEARRLAELEYPPYLTASGRKQLAQHHSNLVNALHQYIQESTM